MTHCFAAKIVGKDFNSTKIALASKVRFVCHELLLEMKAVEPQEGNLLSQVSGIKNLSEFFLQDKIEEEQVPEGGFRRPTMDWLNLAKDKVELDEQKI